LAPPDAGNCGPRERPSDHNLRTDNRGADDDPPLARADLLAEPSANPFHGGGGSANLGVSVSSTKRNHDHADRDQYPDSGGAAAHARAWAVTDAGRGVARAADGYPGGGATLATFVSPDSCSRTYSIRSVADPGHGGVFPAVVRTAAWADRADSAASNADRHTYACPYAGANRAATFAGTTSPADSPTISAADSAAVTAGRAYPSAQYCSPADRACGPDARAAG
jgi:hypothetical protein